MATRLKLLVTGRKGQVARSLAERAVAADVDVAFLARPELDLADVSGVAEATRRAIGRERPDVLVSAAAYTAVDAAEDDAATSRAVNAEAPGELARAAHEAGVPVVHLSTDYVFDGALDRPYREDDPVAPLGVYGATKEAGERAVREAAPVHVILRTAWVVSPFGRNFVKTMLRLAETRDEVSVVNDQRGCPTSALDIADAVIAVARALREGDGQALTGTYHMAAAGRSTWADLARTVFETSDMAGGPTATVRGIPTSEYPTPARRPMNSRLDTTRLSETFGVALPHWRGSAETLVLRLLGEREPTREPPLATVVVPVKNGMPHIQRVLDALAAQELDEPFDVVVIDSGSTDASLDVAREAAKRTGGQVRVVEIEPSTFGHGRTRNLGAAMSDAPFIAFLTHDAMPANEHWLANLLKPLREDERVAGVFSRHLAYEEHGPYVALELQRHFEGLAAFPVCEMTDARAYARDVGLRKVYHFYSDNASALRRSVWEVYPYPDIDFAEDQIWAKTVIERGWRKAFAQDSVVYHSHDYSPFELFRRSYDEARALKELFGYDYLTSRRALLRNWYRTTRDDWRMGRSRGWLRAHPGAMAARPALNLAKMMGLYLGTQNPDYVRRREHLVSRDRALKALRRDRAQLSDATEDAASAHVEVKPRSRDEEHEHAARSG